MQLGLFYFSFASWSNFTRVDIISALHEEKVIFKVIETKTNKKTPTLRTSIFNWFHLTRFKSKQLDVFRSHDRISPLRVLSQQRTLTKRKKVRHPRYTHTHTRVRREQQRERERRHAERRNVRRISSLENSTGVVSSFTNTRSTSERVERTSGRGTLPNERTNSWKRFKAAARRYGGGKYVRYHHEKWYWCHEACERASERYPLGSRAIFVPGVRTRWKQSRRFNFGRRCNITVPSEIETQPLRRQPSPLAFLVLGLLASRYTPPTDPF